MAHGTARSGIVANAIDRPASLPLLVAQGLSDILWPRNAVSLKPCKARLNRRDQTARSEGADERCRFVVGRTRGPSIYPGRSPTIFDAYLLQRVAAARARTAAAGGG